MNVPSPKETTTVFSSFQSQYAPVPADADVSLSNNLATSHVDTRQEAPSHHRPADRGQGEWVWCAGMFFDLPDSSSYRRSNYRSPTDNGYCRIGICTKPPFRPTVPELPRPGSKTRSTPCKVAASLASTSSGTVDSKVGDGVGTSRGAGDGYTTGGGEGARVGDRGDGAVVAAGTGEGEGARVGDRVDGANVVA